MATKTTRSTSMQLGKRPGRKPDQSRHYCSPVNPPHVSVLRLKSPAAGDELISHLL